MAFGWNNDELGVCGLIVCLLLWKIYCTTKSLFLDVLKGLDHTKLDSDVRFHAAKTAMKKMPPEQLAEVAQEGLHFFEKKHE